MTSTASPATPLDKANSHKGFTLIELSIVLVIIGLIVGGILVGRDLITNAGIRAQIAQIQSFSTAAQTFKIKYGTWPGDVSKADAAKFGFQDRTGWVGYGNGDGQINAGDASGCCNQSYGELALFWVDLSAAKLIQGSFTTAQGFYGGQDIPATGVGQYLPQALIGQGNYVYVWASGNWDGVTTWLFTGVSYFGLSSVTGINGASQYGSLDSTVGLTVNQAYAIDQKIDDGISGQGSSTL